MRGLTLVVLLIGVGAASAPAMGAGQMTPTAKDRADARAFIAAAEDAHKTGAAAVAKLPNLIHSNRSTCDGAVGRAINNPSTDVTTLDALQVDAYEFLQLRALAPTVARYGRNLQKVHARDSVLRRYVAYVTATMTPTVERYAAAHVFDICKLFRDWEATAFKAGFDWVSDAHVARDLADRVERNFGAIGTPPTLYNPIGNHLVAFGIRSTVAFWFPNALLHATGQ